jgi:pimeloyl-ACP methyl ester carboxylesterase
MRVAQVASSDGSAVTVHSQGSGPGVVILHGAGVSVRDYQRLAQRLSQRCTVHRYNRRGQADSAPLTGDETAQTDLDDLSAVLDHTRARSVFGHSGGAFVAMRAGLSLPLDRIAVYDPAVAITGVDFPRGFIGPFEDALSAGDIPLAFAVMGRDINRDTAAARLPLGLQELIVKGFLHTPHGKRMVELQPTIGPEVRRILDHEGPASDYASITAEVMLAYGSRSPGYFADTCHAVADALPHATVVPIPRASHNSANIAPQRFAAPFGDFLSASGVPRA